MLTIGNKANGSVLHCLPRLPSRLVATARLVAPARQQLAQCCLFFCLATTQYCLLLCPLLFEPHSSIAPGSYCRRIHIHYATPPRAASRQPAALCECASAATCLHCLAQGRDTCGHLHQPDYIPTPPPLLYFQPCHALQNPWPSPTPSLSPSAPS
ncbi:hypothetical protein EJ04DRAFT_57172 [Polyplosphaeria fusca]|uniref:Uncharacterized protein n=1 Tax=Polyplosphaeria fusca TaxID=682080 RepID=A0A9P4UZ86_9PLEO|nr:hypothetical protein EJ04DRAFT_57172 [Polyplosphaeria fusca]